jgi:hypothetical protein
MAAVFIPLASLRNTQAVVVPQILECMKHTPLLSPSNGDCSLNFSNRNYEASRRLLHFCPSISLKLSFHYRVQNVSHCVPCAKSNESIPYRRMLFLIDPFYYYLHIGLHFLEDFLLKFYEFLICPMRPTCPAHLIFLNIITVII